MSKVPILNLTPIGKFADNSPFYNFHNPFPGAARTLEEVFQTAEDAFDHGHKYCRNYETESFPGGMGVCLGVVACQGGYQAVVSTYYSFS